MAQETQRRDTVVVWTKAEQQAAAGAGSLKGKQPRLCSTASSGTSQTSIPARLQDMGGLRYKVSLAVRREQDPRGVVLLKCGAVVPYGAAGRHTKRGACAPAGRSPATS